MRHTIAGFLTVIGIWVIVWMIHPGLILSIAIGVVISHFGPKLSSRIGEWRAVRAYNRAQKIVNRKRWR